MRVLFRLVQWLVAIYCGVSAGVSAGGKNPAWGTVTGIIVTLIVLILLGIVFELYDKASKKYRDWQRYREYGR